MILFGSAIALLKPVKSSGTTAKIYRDGVCVYSVELSGVKAPYTLRFKGENGYNTVLVENGRICVCEADCPDKICVHQGWISESGAPVVCLPNKLVIKIEKGAAQDIDGVSQ